MRRLGLLGGMSWESSSLYYTLLNQEVRDRLGGMHSARCVMASVDFAEVEELQRAGDWDRAGELLAAEARALEAAGAELLVLCTNTMHRVAPAIERACGIPLLHLGDVTAEAVLAAGLDTVTLLGCTELELLVGADDVPAPVFPTTRLHVLAAVEASLSGP